MTLQHPSGANKTHYGVGRGQPLTLNLLDNRPSLDRFKSAQAKPYATNFNLIHKTPEPYIVHQPQHQEHRQNIGPAGTHQRERDSRNGHPSHHHSDIHQKVKQQNSRDAHADIHSGSIGRRLRVLHNLHQQ